MNTVAFFGGSVPAGVGYTEGKKSACIYPRLIEDQGFKIYNQSKSGSSNYEIFLRCCNFVANTNVDLIVIEWNTFNRFWFYPKFDYEVYISASALSISEKLQSKLDISFSELKKLQKCLLLLSNDYKSILDLLDYCIILQDYVSFITRCEDYVFFLASTPKIHNLTIYDQHQKFSHSHRYGTIRIPFIQRNHSIEFLL